MLQPPLQLWFYRLDMDCELEKAEVRQRPSSCHLWLLLTNKVVESTFFSAAMFQWSVTSLWAAVASWSLGCYCGGVFWKSTVQRWPPDSHLPKLGGGSSSSSRQVQQCYSRSHPRGLAQSLLYSSRDLEGSNSLFNPFVPQIPGKVSGFLQLQGVLSYMGVWETRLSTLGYPTFKQRSTHLTQLAVSQGRANFIFITKHFFLTQGSSNLVKQLLTILINKSTSFLLSAMRDELLKELE